MANKNLNAAKEAKKDEFYTQLADIENELKHYRHHFRGKSILCNCDDPYESNFFKYFANNFNAFGLKKLVATCYNGSPVQGSELMIDFGDFHEEPKKIAYKVEITEVTDELTLQMYAGLFGTTRMCCQFLKKMATSEAASASNF